MIVFLDGAWVDESVAHIAIDDLGFLHADCVFETARLHRGAYFRLDRHLLRLAHSAALLELPAPPWPLDRVALELASRAGITEGTLRITITRGRPGRGPTVLATLQEIAPEWQRRADRGWHVVTARTRRPPVSSVPAQLKSSGRVYSILARLEKRSAGTDDVLLLSAGGDVCEGPTWNVFWRRGSTLRTPSPETGVLEGITRSAIIEIAPAHGLTIEEGEWPRSELDDAEEIFATMSSVGVVPLRSLDGRALPSDAAARLLQARYWDLVVREATPARGTEPA
jgi:branched-chain amino acid aminotransferase